MISVNISKGLSYLAFGETFLTIETAEKWAKKYVDENSLEYCQVAYYQNISNINPKPSRIDNIVAGSLCRTLPTRK